VKSFTMLKLPVILLGFGGALLLSPACKAQEATPDHFTDTGVQDVYEPGAGKATATTAKQKPAVVQALKQQTFRPRPCNPPPSVVLLCSRNPKPRWSQKSASPLRLSSKSRKQAGVAAVNGIRGDKRVEHAAARKLRTKMRRRTLECGGESLCPQIISILDCPHTAA
jgi:hypothetical protein